MDEKIRSTRRPAPTAGQRARFAYTEAARAFVIVVAVFAVGWVALAASLPANAFRPPFVVWEMFFAVQTALWLLIFQSNRADIGRALRRCQGKVYALTVWATLMSQVALTALFFHLPEWLRPLKGHVPEFAVVGPRVFWLIEAHVTIGCALAACIASVACAALVDLRTLPASLDRLARIRGRMRRTAACLSLVLTFSVASTSWGQRSFEALKEVWPQEYVLAVGLLNAFLFVVVYLPLNIEYHRAANRLVDDLYPMREFVPEQANHRASLENHLGLTSKDALESAIATFGPVIAAVFGLALPKD